MSFRLSAIVVCMFAWTSMVRQVEAVPVTSDPPPVTSGLFVELNGENLSAGALSIWVDQANNGNAGSFQNYVQATSGNQPLVTAALAMPNTQTANVVTFARGSTSGNQSSNFSNSDYLRSVAGGNDSSTTFGADIAYNLTAVTYFTVFQSTTNITISGNGNNQRQVIFDGDYAAAANMYVTQTHQAGFDAIGNGVAAAGAPDLYSAVRDNTTLNQIGAGIPNITTSRWYIAATSWDTVSGAIRILFYDELGNVVDRNTTAPNTFPTGITGHTVSALGANPAAVAVAAATNGQALNGNIAEFLMYDTALGTGAVNQVVNYLNNKYFGAATVLPVPEVSSFLLVGMTFLLGGGAWAVHRGISK